MFSLVHTSVTKNRGLALRAPGTELCTAGCVACSRQCMSVCVLMNVRVEILAAGKKSKANGGHGAGYETQDKMRVMLLHTRICYFLISPPSNSAHKNPTMTSGALQR